MGLRRIVNQKRKQYGNFKNTLAYPLICLILLLSSCVHENASNDDIPEVLINLEKLQLNEALKGISYDFIDSFNLDNKVIEVTIDRKERHEIYIILRCRGLSYFEAMNLKPTLTYDINNNSFFVFTGTESLLNPNFDEKKFQDREMEKCNEAIKMCYWYRDGKMAKDAKCTFPYPFSDLKMSPLPPRND